MMLLKKDKVVKMSKFTEIRDNIEDEFKRLEITEEIKRKVNLTLLEEVLPAIDNIATEFNKKLKEQSASERGWNKVRDALVLPLSVDALLWFIHLVLEKTAKETEPKE